MQQRTSRQAAIAKRRRAFTLIEIMVVLALTLVMMVLFASIFQIAGTFVSREKGIAENDQSARILTTVLKNDLQARTMRYIAAFQPSTTVPPDANRRGYFYYSENNPLDDTDDVLQFTVDLTTLNNVPSINAPKGSRVYGLATNLPLPWQAGLSYLAGSLVRPNSSATTGYIYQAPTTGGPFTSAGPEPTWTTPPTPTVDPGGFNWTPVASAPNQPDGDDGVIGFNTLGETINLLGSNLNNTGSSRYAEISYYLRHGNLYRRVLLIRDPYYQTPTPLDSQAYTTANAPLIVGTYPPVPNHNFWTDFDFAARIQTAPPGVKFLSVGSPELSLSNQTPTPGGSIPIGRPDNRFGHDQSGTSSPREYDSNGKFFGRYTDEETSNLTFLFPGSLPAGGSPMAQSTTVTLDTTGAFITQYQGGSRRGEDILLTNVVSFDIKVLDNFYSESAGTDLNRNGIIDAGPAPAFADMGHAAPTGVFRAAANAQTTYGPHPAIAGDTVANAIFDTWHPQFDFTPGPPATAPFSVPPFSGLPNANDGVTSPFNGAPHPLWTALTPYTAGTIVAPDPAQQDPSNPGVPVQNGLQYVCVGTGTTGAAPNFRSSDIPSIPPTAITDGTAKWVCQGTVPAVQITVKYLDPSQNLLRQVTIVQSLTLP